MSRRHRRIKYDRLQTIYICNRTVTKDSEGVPVESFGEPYSVRAEVWPATERRQVETYGDRITGISNVRIVGEYTMGPAGATGATGSSGAQGATGASGAQGATGATGTTAAPYFAAGTPREVGIMLGEHVLRVGDGVRINTTSEPDFRVLTITPYKPVRLEIERI